MNKKLICQYCEKCNTTLITIVEAQKPKQECHKNVKKSNYECDNCSLSCASKNILKKHKVKSPPLLVEMRTLWEAKGGQNDKRPVRILCVTYFTL